MHHHSRRDFLRLAVSGSLAATGVLDQAVLRAAQARVQSVTAPSSAFDIEKVDEGVYIALSRPMAILNCNAAIFVNSRDVLVVDTHSRPSAAAALVAQIRRQITPKPVRYVVNTHFHYDHSQGTGAYAAMNPAPDIIGTSLTRSLLIERGSKFVQTTLENSRKNIENYKEQLAKTTAPEQKQYYQRVIGELQEFAREMKDYSPELPNITFDRDLTIHDRDRELRLAFRGRAHTASDICVFCTKTKSLATGDLVVGFVPGMGDGFPLEWPATLDGFAELSFTKVLPGHGPVQTGRERFQQQRAYIAELIEAVEKAKRGGRSVEEAQRSIGPGALRSMDANGFGGYVAAAEGRYRLRAPGSPIQDQIANAVKGNVAAIYAAL